MLAHIRRKPCGRWYIVCCVNNPVLGSHFYCPASCSEDFFLRFPFPLFCLGVVWGLFFFCFFGLGGGLVGWFFFCVLGGVPSPDHIKTISPPFLNVPCCIWRCVVASWSFVRLAFISNGSPCRFASTCFTTSKSPPPPPPPGKFLRCLSCS